MSALLRKFQKIIFTGFEPNLQAADMRKALAFVFFPWRWRRWREGPAVEKTEAWLREFFRVPAAITFDSGRSALAAALLALDAGQGYDVLVQAYTCVVVVNAIQSVGARPVFVDVKDQFFMDAEDAERKITPRTKAMIIQHTFGIPADLDALMAVAKKYGIKVVEDCAHAIGATYRGKLLGTWGDVGMFSFGSDKFLSCVRGGAAITAVPEAVERLRSVQIELPLPPRLMIARALARYPIFFIGKPLYQLSMGKALLWLSRKARLIDPIITKGEKTGGADPRYPTRMPNVLAELLSRQVHELDAITNHRKKIASLYARRISNPRIWKPVETRSFVSYAYLRYPIIVENPKDLRAYAKRHGILLGDWYDAVVAPCEDGCSHVGYDAGSCPHAESATKGSVNLPTDVSIGEQEAMHIVNCLNTYAGQ